MIYVTGATGFIGYPLCRHLMGLNRSVCAITRRTEEARSILGSGVDVMSWSDIAIPDFSFEEGDAIINLAGENVGNDKWTESKKRKILNSRLDAAAKLVESIQRSPIRPAVLMQGSGAGYYGDGGSEVLTEDSPKGAEFLSSVAAQCELAVNTLESTGVRVVSLRTSVVLGAFGGALPRMLEPLKYYMGGVPGSGKQYISWIHLDDEVRAIQYLLDHKELRGPVNLAAPDNVDAKTFFKQAGRIIKKPVWLKIPGWLIKLTMGQKGFELVLSSKRVVSKKLLESGFEFSYPSLGKALENILKKNKGEL